MAILPFAHPGLCARRSLTIISNADGHYGKSKRLKSQSECMKYLCHIIRLVLERYEIPSVVISDLI